MTNIGTELQRIESQKADFFDFERKAQGYLDEIYKSLGAEIVTRKGDTKRDVVLSYDGKEHKVEEKIRDVSISGKGDVAIEVLQAMESPQAERFLGWFYTEGFDRLVYAWCEKETGKPVKVLSFDWARFKLWLLNWLCKKKFIGALVSCKGWGKTLNLLIPMRDIPEVLYKILAG